MQEGKARRKDGVMLIYSFKGVVKSVKKISPRGFKSSFSLFNILQCAGKIVLLIEVLPRFVPRLRSMALDLIKIPEAYLFYTHCV